MPVRGRSCWQKTPRQPKRAGQFARRGAGINRPARCLKGGRSKPLEQVSHFKPDHFCHCGAEIRAAAGVSDLTFGDLRDTAITRLYEAGANALQIASWSGHSLKTVHQILEHYIDHQNSVADEVGIRLAAWATARGISV